MRENADQNNSKYRHFLCSEYFDMATSKTHIISALMTSVLFVQESMEECLQQDSGDFGDTLHSAALSFLKNDWKLILAKRFLWFDLFAWLLRDVIPWSVIFIRIAGSRGTWEALVPQIFETCKKWTFKNNEKSYKLQYFYLVKILKEEFHGLYKACDIKSELNYNGDLEGSQPLNIKTIF